jgi:hypothetical protein
MRRRTDTVHLLGRMRATNNSCVAISCPGLMITVVSGFVAALTALQIPRQSVSCTCGVGSAPSCGQSSLVLVARGPTSEAEPGTDETDQAED